MSWLCFALHCRALALGAPCRGIGVLRGIGWCFTLHPKRLGCSKTSHASTLCLCSSAPPPCSAQGLHNSSPRYFLHNTTRCQRRPKAARKPPGKTIIMVCCCFFFLFPFLSFFFPPPPTSNHSNNLLVSRGYQAALDSFGTAAESCQVLSAWRGGRAVSSWQEQSPGQLSTTAPPTSQPQQTPGARCVHAQPSLEVVNSAVKPSISRNSFKVGNKKWRVFKLLMGFMFLSLLRVCSLL